MKNKKGFTLIELLVTIALMLSILGIAIVSFIKVSDKKKEESWEKVKNQTELAAEEYFKTNEYYLTGKKSARVSIGKLVSENYLTIVTNPVTGKAVNNCDYVDVTYGENGYSYKYVENTNNKVCDTDNYIVTSEVGAPKMDVTLTNSANSTGWYITDTNIMATVKENGNGAIASVKYCTSSSGNCNNYESISLTKKNVYNVTNYKLSANKGGVDGNNVTTTFTATNTAGKTVTGYVTYKKDTVTPICSYTIDKQPSSTGWYNNTTGAPTIIFNGADELSGIDGKSKIKPTIVAAKNKTYSYTFKDKAGNNSNKCSVTIKYDNTNPRCSLSLVGTLGNKVGDLQWYKSNVTVNASFSDELSGTSSKGLSTSKNSNNGKTTANQTEETSKVTWYGHITDEAGNSGSCSKTFALEKKVTLSFDINTTNEAKATASGAEGGKVFNTGYSDILKYSDTDYSGNCLRKKGDSYAGCAVDSGNNKFYFGISCMDIDDFIRTFNVSSKSFNGSAIYGGGETTSEGLEHIETGNDKSYSKKQYPDSTFGKSYKAADLNNNGSRVNFTKHTFQYTSPAGNKSNFVTLYTQYTVNCDY